MIPKERKPTLVEKQGCIYLKNIRYIHDYKTFSKHIIQPFLSIIKPTKQFAFLNTCNYMFHDVGYGVFVFILEGNIHTYQVFANTTELKPGTQSITRKMIAANNKATRKNKKGIPITNKKQMGFHYCMFKAYKEWYKSETDKSIYFHMIETCLSDTNITTCFFLNLNTFPVLFKRKCGQYILHQDVCKSNPQIRNKHIPVLSGASTKEHFDKCIVYPDAWEIVTRKRFGAFSTNNFIDAFDKINTDWQSKQNAIVFRGENKTCYPLDKERNERIKVIELFNQIKKNKINKIDIDIDIDVGLVNVKPKNFYIDNAMNTEHLSTESSVEKIPMDIQSNYKYILDIDGHANPWRLCFELGYNSCIIVMMSHYYSWFYDKLHHLKNVYIIDVNSLHLDSKIQSCLQTLERNDKLGKSIAKGARKLYKEIINFEYIRQYMIDLVTEPDFDLIDVDLIK